MEMNRWPKAILITGASGWLGRRLVEVLIQGLPDDVRFGQPDSTCRIHCLVQAESEAAALRNLGTNVDVQIGDLRDPQTCREFCSDAAGAILVHAAGVIHPRRVREFYDVNVQGSRNVLSAAEQSRIRRAVIISSNSPCGCNPRRDVWFDENAPFRPYMNYGRSKMLLEQHARELNANGRVETVLLRPPWFYGPNQPPRQTLFFDMIRRGKAPIVGDGQHLRSMCYIDNLCQAVLLAATLPQAAGETYWIADARPYPMTEIIDSVERLLEQEFGVPCAHRRLRLPGVASEIAWLADSVLQKFRLYHQKVHVLSEMNKTIACRIDKAVSQLGYVPHVELVEGMRRSLRWLRETVPDAPLWKSHFH